MASQQDTRIAEVPQGEAAALFAALQPLFGLPKSPGDIERVQQHLDAGHVTLLAYGREGYVLYNTKPRYAPFARLRVPEIQDLNVHPDHRGEGIATALVKACERKALLDGCDMIGLGVGLHSSYGPAQKLYCKLGYHPDGAGLVHDGIPVEYGHSVINDDDLCLMMIKDLP